jgi:hypothetical protein
MGERNRGLGALNRRDVLAGVVGLGAVNALSGLSPAQSLTASSAGPVASTEYGKVRTRRKAVPPWCSMPARLPSSCCLPVRN